MLPVITYLREHSAAKRDGGELLCPEQFLEGKVVFLIGFLSWRTDACSRPSTTFQSQGTQIPQAQRVCVLGELQRGMSETSALRDLLLFFFSLSFWAKSLGLSIHCDCFCHIQQFHALEYKME